MGPASRSIYEIQTIAQKIWVESVLLALLLFAIPGWAEAELFKVIIVNDPAYPALGVERVNQMLGNAKATIKKGFNREIHFKVEKTVGIEELFINFEKYIDPYQIPPESYLDLHGINLDAYDEKTIAADLKLLTPERLSQNDKETKKLIDRVFFNKLKIIRGLKNEKGALMMTSKNWKFFSFFHWNVYLSQFIDNSSESNLYLYNGLLIDNDINRAKHASIRGGIINGFATGYLRNCVVSTFPVLSQMEYFKGERDGELNAGQEEQAVACIVAHEIGAHLLMGCNDNYLHPGCLAVPPRGLEYLAYLKALDKLFPCKMEHVELDLSYPGLFFDLQVLHAKKDHDLARDRLFDGITNLNLSPRNLAELCNFACFMLGYLDLSPEEKYSFRVYFCNKAIYYNPEFEKIYMDVYKCDSRDKLPWNKEFDRAKLNNFLRQYDTYFKNEFDLIFPSLEAASQYKS